MFRSIFELIDRIRSPESSRPKYDLSEEDFKYLELLRDKKEFEVYLKAVDRQANFIADGLLASQDSYNDTLQKGILLGLRKAGTLVDEILQQRHHAAESKRRRTDRGPDQLQRTAALFGSPAWGRTLTR